jgi:hypothetical protein
MYDNDRIRVTSRLAVYRQSFRLGDKPIETHDQRLYFQLSPCGHSPYVTPSLERGWVCSFQLLLALASAVILRSEYRGTHDHILLSQMRDSSNLEGRSRYSYSPRREWPGYTPRHWVPFSSPPVARRATVELFDPASTQDDFSFKAQQGLHRKHLSHHCVFSRWWGKNGSRELFPSNGCCTVACLHGCSLNWAYMSLYIL